MPSAVLPVAGDPDGSGMRATSPAASPPYPAAMIAPPESADPHKIWAGSDTDDFVLHRWRPFVYHDLAGRSSRIRAHDAAGHRRQGCERGQYQ